MVIGGFQKTTLLDYPGKVACIIFTQGCNFNCSFCHNSSLIDVNQKGSIEESEIFKYLEKRKNILDAVCITGGEPLLQKDIKDFIIKVKEFGYKVKLDTNGSNPRLLKELLKENLLDYVAMDIKSTFIKYSNVSGVKVNTDNIKESIELLENSNIDYEFRTTIIKEFHSLDDIKEICKILNGKSKYYIQNFRNSDGVLAKNLNGFSDKELEQMRKELLEIYPNILFRDI